ncbi:MAG: sensor histidine kinase [Deltaproteobacteria bacterium]|nr:MAG: sensor histidine kinase [Deltaproteobacteria bacterium]
MVVLASILEDLMPAFREKEEAGSVESGLFDEMVEITGDCVHGVDRISEIVQALKGSVRTDRDASNFDPCKVIEDSVTVFSRAHKHECQVDLDLDAVPAIRGMPGKLGQVVLNLLENGLDAMNGEGRLEVRARAEDDSVVITVRDFGSGIAPEVADRIFLPFFTTKEVGKGTGLGLYICHEIIVGMCGSLRFEEANPGTRFVITLPVAEAFDPAAARLH